MGSLHGTALARWGRDRSFAILGSGKACTDYATILCTESSRRPVVAALWDWLNNSAPTDGERPQWDLLELEGVVDDPTIDEFVLQGRAVSSYVAHRELEHCWRIPIAPDWGSYLATLGRKYRAKVRSICKKYLDAGQVEFQVAQNESQRHEFLNLLVDLHQRRRNSLGDEGCFSCPRFSGFLRDVVQCFGEQGALALACVRVRGQVAAVALALIGDDTLFQYQCGMDPARSTDNPGWLMNLLMVRECQRRGINGFDLMRGDESYKSHLAGEPKSCHRWRLVPRRTIPQIRYHVWEAGAQFRDWAQTAWSGVTHG